MSATNPIPDELVSRGFQAHKCNIYIAWEARKVYRDDTKNDGTALWIEVRADKYPGRRSIFSVDISSAEWEATASIANGTSLAELLPVIDALISAMDIAIELPVLAE